MCKQAKNAVGAILRSYPVIASILIVTLALANAGPLKIVMAKAGQQPVQGAVSVTPSFGSDQRVLANETFELQLDRVPERSEGKIAILIGSMDLTSLFERTDNKLTYNAKLFSLPLGDSELTVYLISASGEWKEIARFPMKISNDRPGKPALIEAQNADKPQTAEPKLEQTKPGESKPGESKPEEPKSERKTVDQTQSPSEASVTKEEKPDAAAQQGAASPTQEQAKPAAKKFGFDKLDFVPAITMTIKSQPFQSNFPSANRPDRATFTDANMTGSFKTELARGRFSSQTQFDFAGSSFQKEALRFGELGKEAPNVDLASYLTQYQIGKIKYLIGHTSYGSNRHLINSFSSRGMTLAAPLSSTFDVSLAAMNGSAVVGFDNFFGLANRRHQLLAGTLGMELFPKRPGGFRLETSVMEGWLLPVSGVNQGVVNDAERSKGFGFRVVASDPSQRFRFEGGFTRSEFVNPADAKLNQGQRVVELKPIWKSARYIDAAYDIFKGFPITKDKKLNLTVNFKHELVDPLYKSLGASAQADKITNEFLINGSLGEITAQYAHQRFNDNLADIPSILKSNTRVNTFSMAAPLASLFAHSAEPNALLPKVSYTFNRTFQFGAAVPINGGFEIDPAAVPDQISTNQGLTVDWQFKKWKLGYRTNHSFQNNQQKGNENADLSNFVNGVTVGINPNAAVDLAFDFNAESAFDKKQNTTNRNYTVAPNITWRVNKKMSFVSNVSFNVAGDVADITNNRNINFDFQYSYQFAKEKDRWRKVGGQFSIKYTNTFAHSQNSLARLSDLKKNQTLFAQMSFTFF